MALTYHSYLKLDDLLNAQEPQAKGEHDEMLFIIIHQVYELWFKQVLHEGQLLRSQLRSCEINGASNTLKRILKIMKTMVGQVDILETMTPLSFAGFRHALETSSGFQSVQFRYFEAFLGKRSPAILDHLHLSNLEKEKMREIYSAPSIYEELMLTLHQRGIMIPSDILDRSHESEYEGDLRVQDIFLNVYRTNPEISAFLELFVDLDEGVQEWRYRHVKMVERTIGAKMGTGGSPGVEYLRNTLFKPMFIDLWRIRSQF